MRYQTRLALCRLGFLVFCVLPTGLVAVWIVWPDPTASWESMLSSHLGIVVTLDEASNPRPGMTRMRGLRLTDPETGTVATVPLLEITQSSRGWSVLASQPVVHLSQVARIHAIVQDRVLRTWSAGTHSLTLYCAAVNLVDPPPGSPASVHLAAIRDVDCNVTSTEHSSQLSLSFRPTETVWDHPMELVIERIRHPGSSPSTRWFLKTNGTPLPCRLVSQDLKSLEALGSGCQFNGLVWAERSSNGWSGDVNGRFTHVDLNCLVGRQFPHTLRGFAEVELRRATLLDGRLVSAAGSITAPVGEIGASLMAAAHRHLNAKLAQETVTERGFRELDFSFQIDSQSLTIRGHCDEQGTLVQDEFGQPLLVEAPNPTVDVLALVHTLVPPSDLHVPLTRETASILSLFPLPSAKAPELSATRH